MTKYSHASHIFRVKKHSNARMAAAQVLSWLCDRAEFDKPEVTITKNQIVKLSGLERKAVQNGLRKLRLEGCIVPIQGFEGGRGVAPTYRLVVVGQGAETPEGSGGVGRKFPISEFNRIHRADGLDAAMTAKRKYEEP